MNKTAGKPACGSWAQEGLPTSWHSVLDSLAELTHQEGVNTRMPQAHSQPNQLCSQEIFGTTGVRLCSQPIGYLGPAVIGTRAGTQIHRARARGRRKGCRAARPGRFL